MVYQRTHTGIIRKLFVGGGGLGGGVRFILAPPPARLSERLGQTYALHLSLFFSFYLSFSLTPQPLSFSPSHTLAFSLPLSLSPAPSILLSPLSLIGDDPLSSLSPRALWCCTTPARWLTQPNPRANFIPRRLTTTDGRRRVLDAAVVVAASSFVIERGHATRQFRRRRIGVLRSTDVRGDLFFSFFFLAVVHRPPGVSRRYCCDWDTWLDFLKVTVPNSISLSIILRAYTIVYQRN